MGGCVKTTGYTPPRPERFVIFYELNPMTHLVDAYRAVLIRSETPDLSSLSMLSAFSLIVLGLAYLFFRRASANFVEQL